MVFAQNPIKLTNQTEKITLFYLERILEVLEADCILLGREIFRNHQLNFGKILDKELFNHLQERMKTRDIWDEAKERSLLLRLQNAYAFGEHKIVHDLAHEILLHHNHPADSCPTHDICNTVNSILADNNCHYLEPDEIRNNTFINATVAFVVEDRRPKQKDTNVQLKGNPGFYLQDILGNKYRCFVKQVNQARIGDVLSLKITNVPGLTINSSGDVEQIIYLEPRVTPGETIEVELNSLSHTGNSFTFRHHSYDGFLWFKRRGVNKEIFNQNTLVPGNRILARVLYTSEEVKTIHQGKIARLGVIKAIPIRWVDEELTLQEHPETDAAKALS
ncbi:MAG: hypothetical protein ACOX5R_02475 [bacterium]